VATKELATKAAEIESVKGSEIESGKLVKVAATEST